MVSMRRAMDRLIDNTYTEETGQPSEWGLALDVSEDEDAYLVKASLPGIKPEDLEVTYNKGLLSIRGQVKDDSEITKGEYHIRERRFGSFSRSISLPSTVRADDIQADYEDGILTLKLPKSEEVKPRRIQVQSGAEKKVIDAKSS